MYGAEPTGTSFKMNWFLTTFYYIKGVTLWPFFIWRNNLTNGKKTTIIYKQTI
jgi:hypothetical protein